MSGGGDLIEREPVFPQTQGSFPGSSLIIEGDSPAVDPDPFGVVMPDLAPDCLGRDRASPELLRAFFNPGQQVDPLLGQLD